MRKRSIFESQEPAPFGQWAFALLFGALVLVFYIANVIGPRPGRVTVLDTHPIPLEPAGEFTEGPSCATDTECEDIYGAPMCEPLYWAERGW